MKNNSPQSPRRTFLKTSALMSAGMISLSTFSSATEKKKQTPATATVLFQGDSITDAGRNKESTKANDNRAMGSGYALLSAAKMIGENPNTEWKYYNRGISGHKVPQLAERWDQDCIDLKPDVLSILIGVNDFWHTLTHDYKGTAKTYEKDFRALLDSTKTALPGIKIIIGQPFVLKGGSSIENDKWFPAFYEYQAAAKKIADDYKTAWIPYQEIFDNALKKAPQDYWSWDGVHPSFAGCYLMSEGWIKAFNSFY